MTKNFHRPRKSRYRLAAPRRQDARFQISVTSSVFPFSKNNFERLSNLDGAEQSDSVDEFFERGRVGAFDRIVHRVLQRRDGETL